MEFEICICHGQQWETQVDLLEHQVRHFATLSTEYFEKYDRLANFVDVYKGDLDELYKYQCELEAREIKCKLREAEVEKIELSLSIRQLNLHIQEMNLQSRVQRQDRREAAWEEEQ